MMEEDKKREIRKRNLFLQKFKDFSASEFHRGLVTRDHHMLAGVIRLGGVDLGASLFLEGFELGALLADQGAKVLPGNLNLDLVLLGEASEELLLGNPGLLDLASNQHSHGSVLGSGALNLGASLSDDALDDLRVGLVTKARGAKLGRLNLEPLGVVTDLGGERHGRGGESLLRGPGGGRQRGEHVRVGIVSGRRDRDRGRSGSGRGGGRTDGEGAGVRVRGLGVRRSSRGQERTVKVVVREAGRSVHGKFCKRRKAKEK